MRHVVFIAPKFLENTNRYVRAFASLDDVKLSVISGDPAEAIPADVRSRVAGHYRVGNPMDGQQLADATRAIGTSVGTVDRLAGVLEQLQTPLAEVRDALGIEGVTRQIARNFRDKDRMKDVLRGAGVPVARSTLARSRAELEAFIARVGFPVIVKPQAGLGTRGTYRIENADELAALSAPSASAPAQVEEFIRAREHTCETVSLKGKHVWRSGTRYFPSPLEVVETPWIQYSVLLPREVDDATWRQFDAINAAALDALFGDAATTAAGSALTHMEWFLRDDGTALVNEVGVRPPGVQIMPLMSLAHEMDMFVEWARIMALDEFTPKPRKWAAGSAFFRGHGKGKRVISVTGIEVAIEQAGSSLVEMRTPKVGQARADSYEGEGWALVKAESTEEAKRALLALIKNVQVRYG